MEEFKIATFNVKDKGPVGNIVTNGIDRPAKLADYLLRENIAAMGTQEATKGYLAHLSANLPEMYNIVGDYRQLVNPFFNEANAIITPHEVLTTETIKLPHRPKGLILSNPIRSLTDVHKRTATWALINMPRIGKVIIIDIHFTYLRENPNNNLKLEHFNEKMSVTIDQQFKDTLNLQSDLRALYPEYPIITMGDFNAPIYYKSFEEYIIASQKIGMLQVFNFEKTQKNNEAPIDHIFYTGDLLDLRDYEVSNDLEKISDHKVLIATFRGR